MGARAAQQSLQHDAEICEVSFSVLAASARIAGLIFRLTRHMSRVMAFHNDKSSAYLLASTCYSNGLIASTDTP